MKQLVSIGEILFDISPPYREGIPPAGAM